MFLSTRLRHEKSSRTIVVKLLVEFEYKSRHATLTGDTTFDIQLVSIL